VCTPGSVQRLSTDRVLDCLGLFRTLPIVKTREVPRATAAGQILEMPSDDPTSDADMRRARRTGKRAP
jgi:TusA-related sulfurtransferase